MVEGVNMKILVVGDGHSDIHEVAVANAFLKLGHEVRTFYWQNYFDSNNKLVKILLKAQNKFLIGSVINKINKDLLRQAVVFYPKIIFIYRGTHIKSNAIQKLKKALPECTLFGYNNDDPFSKGHPPWLWRQFLSAVPYYDIMFAYRKHNIDEFYTVGAKQVELLMPWFIPEKDKPIETGSVDFKYDVVFVGHYEDDGRLEYLEEICKSGYNLGLFGPPNEWDHLLKESKELKHLSPVRLVWNDEYNKVICSAKIALCFFSKLNRDTYTRRCFEIPAIGTMLLSEYSDDLASIYKAGIEADFFKNKDEMIQKIGRYSSDEVLRNTVALNGNQRVINDGHDIQARMLRVLEFVDP